MKLIAKKPCSFGGKSFFIGDEIPSELVIDPKAQEMMGKLVIVGDASTGAQKAVTAPVSSVSIVVHAEEGDMPLEISTTELQKIFDVLTGNVEDGEDIIKEMTDDDALILLHITDGRKSIKAAAEARAKALNENTESAGEQ